MALLGVSGDERYDVVEEVDGGLDSWGTFEGAAAGHEDRPSMAFDLPVCWMNRSMAVGDVLESPVTGRFLSARRWKQESVLKTTIRLEVVAHRGSFTTPAADELTCEGVLEDRFWSDVERMEAHDTFYLARGYGAVLLATVRGCRGRRGRRVLGGGDDADAGRSVRAGGSVVRPVLRAGRRWWC